MGVFDGLKNAKVTDKSAYLNPGKYKVKVEKCIWKPTRSKGDAFILEMGILDSSFNPAVHIQGGRKIVGCPNESGTKAAWYQSCKDRDIGFGALKGFAAQITGSNPDDPGFVAAVEGLLESFLGGALNGVELEVEVTPVKTKSGGDFSLHKWSKAA